MKPRSSLAGTALVVLALGCRDNTTGPSAPADPSPPRDQLTAAATAPAFYQLSAGEASTCAVTTTNQAYCWGDNERGALGDGTTTAHLTPHLVAGGLAFRRVSVGLFHTCGVTTDFRAFCWGWNQYGQLGDGTNTGQYTPVAVAGTTRFRTVEAGYLHSCGVTYPDNRVLCWGGNDRGQLGDGTNVNHSSPKPVLGGRQFRQVGVGYSHSCGVTTDNWAYCWGDSQFGQVGDSTRGWLRLKPARVAGTRQFRQIDAGGYFTCAVTLTDRAYCWGRNDGGQLGDGTLGSKRFPVAVVGGRTFSRVTAGGGPSWGIACGESAKRAYCWGRSALGGGTGDGTTAQHSAPVAIAPDIAFYQLTAGSWYACGKTEAGAAYCWGWNGYGQVGDGTTTSRLIPTPVAGPS